MSQDAVDLSESSSVYRYVRNKATGYYLAANDVNQQPGWPLQVREKSPSSDDSLFLWTLTANGELLNKGTRQVVQGSGGPWTGLILALAAESEHERINQRWILTANGQIGSRADQRMVVTFASPFTPGPAQLASRMAPLSPMQVWQLVESDVQDPGGFFVEHVRTGGRLTPVGGRVAIGCPVAVEPVSVPYPRAQLWTWASDGALRNRDSGLVATMDSAMPQAAILLENPQNRLNSTQPDQRWAYQADGTIISADNPDYALGTASSDPGGGIVRLVPRNNSTDQQWLIRRAVTPEPARSMRATHFVPNLSAMFMDSHLPAIDDITCEAWVRSTAGGPVIAAGGRNSTYLPLALFFNPDGVIVFTFTGTDAPSGRKTAATFVSKTTSIADGGWHHVAGVRRNGLLSVYLDGISVLSQEEVRPAGARGVLADQQLTFGIASPSHALLQNWWLDGDVGEIRLWNRARTDVEIPAFMHHQVDDDDRNLLGRWAFIDDTGRDGSLSHRDAQFTGSPPSPSFLYSDVELVAAGDLYLVTQAKLMQDYVYDPTAGSITEVEGYRVTLAIRDGEDQPSAGFITLALNNPQTNPTATLHFIDGTTVMLDATHPTVHLATDPQGELGFTMEAGGDLVCATLRVQADFMTDGSWLVIAPDRQAHAALSAISGNGLRGRDQNGNPLANRVAPLPETVDASTADSLATAVRQFMASATNHDAIAGTPQIRELDNLIPLPAARPYVPRYQQPGFIATGHDPITDVIATHYVDREIPVARIVNPDNAQHPHWAFDTRFASQSVWSAAAELDNIGTLTPVGDLARQLIPDFGSKYLTGVAECAVTSEKFNHAARANIANTAALSSWLSEHIAGAVRVLSNVVMITVKDVTGIERTVKQIVVTAVDKFGQGLFALVQTVEHAVACVQGLLKRFGADLGKLVSFLKDLFEWDDVLMAQRVIQAYITNLQPFVVDVLNSATGVATKGIEQFRKSIDDRIDSWKQALMKLGSQQTLRSAATAPPPNLKSGYINRMANSAVSNMLSNPDFSGSSPSTNPSLEQLAAAMAEDWLTAVGDSISDIPQQIVDSPIGTVHSVQTFLLDGVEILLNTLKAFVDASLLCVEKLIASTSTRIQQLLAAIFEIAEIELPIPIIEPFYRMITKGRPLTALGLASLLAAASATFTYKLTHDGKAPISAASALEFESLSWTDYTWLANPFAQKRRNTAVSVPKETIFLASTGLYLAGSFLLGPAACANDLLFCRDVDNGWDPWNILGIQLKYQIINPLKRAEQFGAILFITGSLVLLASAVVDVADASAGDVVDTAMLAVSLVAAIIATLSTVVAAANERWAAGDTFIQFLSGAIQVAANVERFITLDDHTAPAVVEFVSVLMLGAMGVFQGIKFVIILAAGLTARGIAESVLLALDILGWAAGLGCRLAFLAIGSPETSIAVREYVARYLPETPGLAG